MLGLPRGTVQLADALRSYIPNSGIFHEAALLEGSGGEDLKGYLLRWLALKPEGLFSRYARVMLAHIEAYQARSVGSEHLVVPFALVWGEEPINGEIRFEAPHGKAGETETAGGVRINLSMPGLGPVEVGLWWTGQALSVRLAVVTPVEQLVRERAPELLETLTGTAGLTVRSLQVETRLESVPHPDGPLFEVTA